MHIPHSHSYDRKRQKQKQHFFHLIRLIILQKFLVALLWWRLQSSLPPPSYNEQTRLESCHALVNEEKDQLGLLSNIIKLHSQMSEL